MNQKISDIATKIDDIPSILAKHLADVMTTLPATPTDPHLLSSGPKIVVPPQLNRKDFPKVVHWTQGYYNSLRKATKAEEEAVESLGSDAPMPGSSKRSCKKSGQKGVSTLSCFIEDKNGEQIPEDTKDAARAKAKAFWVKLFNRGIAPPCHGEADINIQEGFQAHMENAFPWLRYCENHWKTDQIWRNHYSDWYRTKKNAEAKEKAEQEKAAREKAAREKAAAEGEVIDVDTDSPGSSQEVQEGSSKRPRVDDETSEPKRCRVEEVQSTPPSRPTATKKITPKRLRVCFMICITWTYISLTIFRRTYCTKSLGICAPGFLH